MNKISFLALWSGPFCARLYSNPRYPKSLSLNRYLEEPVAAKARSRAFFVARIHSRRPAMNTDDRPRIWRQQTPRAMSCLRQFADEILQQRQRRLADERRGDEAALWSLVEWG